MEGIREIISIYNTEIILGLMVGFIILLLLYIIAEIRISKTKKKYNKIVRGVDGLNLEQLLIKTGKEIQKIFIDINIMHLQKWVVN